MAGGIERLVPGQLDQQTALIRNRAQLARRELGTKLLDALVDLDEQGCAGLRNRADRGGPQQPAAIYRHQAVANLLDLAEQEAAHEYEDTELYAVPRDQH